MTSVSGEVCGVQNPPFLSGLIFTLRTCLSQQRCRNRTASSCCMFPRRPLPPAFLHTQESRYWLRVTREDIYGLGGSSGVVKETCNISCASVVIDFSLQYTRMSNSSV